MPLGFLWAVHPGVVVDGLAAQLLVHPAGEVVAVAGQQAGGPLLRGRRRLADGRVQRPQVAARPVVGCRGREPGELGQRGGTPLGGDEAVMLVGDLLQLGAPAALHEGTEILLGPGPPVSCDEVPYPLEAVPAGAVTHAGGERHLPVRGLDRTVLAVRDLLLRPEELLGGLQFAEEGGVDRASGRAQDGQRPAVVAVDTVQGGAGVGAFAHEPDGQAHAVPELGRGT